MRGRRGSEVLEGFEVRMNKVVQTAKSLLFEPGDTLSQRVVRGGFWVSALRGFILFAVLYLAAPYIALFFGTPAATPIMRFI